MRILCVPDLECWYPLYSVPGPDGVPTRLADWRLTAQAMVALAVRERCQAALFSGDAFLTPHPPEQAIIEIVQLFQQLERAGIPVIGGSGNHDDPGPGQKGPVHLLAEFRPRWGITTPQVVDLDDLQVAVLPWAKPANFLDSAAGAGDLINRVSQALVSIARALALQCDPDRPAVLLGHWPVDGCVTSTGDILVGREPALPLSELQALPFRACILGHIHKPQVFPGRPLVLHTGALQRRDFGYESDPIGAYIVDTETGEAVWHDLPARRLWTQHLRGDSDVQAWVDGHYTPEALAVGARDAICRVTYRCTEELHRRVDAGAMLRALYDAGAHLVTGVYPEIVKADRARAAEVTESTDPDAAMQAWLQLQSGLSLELREAVQIRFRTMRGLAVVQPVLEGVG